MCDRKYVMHTAATTVTCNLQACEGECNALRDECRAISEDLEVLVKENQVINHQLTTASTERCEQLAIIAAVHAAKKMAKTLHHCMACACAFAEGEASLWASCTVLVIHSVLPGGVLAIKATA